MKRTRTLTSKAMAAYDEKSNELDRAYLFSYNRLEKFIDSEICEENAASLELELDKRLHEAINDYDKYCSYLQETRTQQSLNSAKELDKRHNHVIQRSVIMRDKLTKYKQVSEKNFPAGIFSPLKHSVASGSGSHRSRAASKVSSSMMAIKYAEAQAMLAKAEFAEKELILKKEQALIEEEEKIAKASNARKIREIEADLELLSQRKAAAAAEAELKVFESLSLDEDTQPRVTVPIVDAEQKVAKFVIDANENGKPTDVQRTQGCGDGVVGDLAQYLIRKDLLVSRLSAFDDICDNYNSWKTTFRQVMLEMKARPSEELDLLIKYLGKDSRRHAINLRSVYARDPDEGLRKVWCRLDERYGSPEVVHRSVQQKLDNFPRFSHLETTRWYDLADTLAGVLALQQDPVYANSLAYFDSSVGVSPILSKLPTNVQEKWATKVIAYRKSSGKVFPPFSKFVDFIHDQAEIRNNASQPLASSTSISVKTTNFEDVEKCPIHKTQHKLENCRVFNGMLWPEKRKLLSEKRLCFKCFSSDHLAKDCARPLEEKNPGAPNSETSVPPTLHGGEPKPSVSSLCTEICGEHGSSKSCAKIVLVNVFSQNDINNVTRCYCMIDEQSNRSLIKPELLSQLGVTGENHEYTLKTCAGSEVVSGRRVENVVVRSLDGSCTYKLPTLIECSDIPNDKNEICTPDNARCHDHLKHVADYLPELDTQADVLLLLGRDVIEAHQVSKQVLGPPGAPFAQCLGLGWVVIGELCLDTMHSQSVVNVNKTNYLPNGRPSLFKPCTSKRSVIDHVDQHYHYDQVFVRSPDDNKPSLSMDDNAFLQVMDSGLQKDDKGLWVAPLPFRSPRQQLPNNRALALRRARMLDSSLRKNPVKRQHCVDFMDKVLANGHAELAPTLKQGAECWYLPLFGVYHPKKPNQIRMVFDSSAAFEGVSLNSVLLQGPDLVNSLVGVLMRFRSDQVAVMADIEQMFYSFSVQEDHRDFLRFFWYEGNDPDNKLVEFRMSKHVFGNSPSPAIATYGLHKSVEQSDDDVRKFVHNDFYVDDGLTSAPSAKDATDLLERTRSDLSGHGLRLHKISSNCPEVMRAFPQEDLAKNLSNIDLDNCRLPQQRSLGVSWDLCSDSFAFTLSMAGPSYTRRGILSFVNSIFDPLGFLSPVTICGKLILRDVTAHDAGWDDPAPPELQQRWIDWCVSLQDLAGIKVPRPYFDSQNLSVMSKVELHVFSDASEKAIAAVAYVVGISKNEEHVGFVTGKAKVAPSSGHTIPRLELCGAVLAVELSETVREQLGVEISDTHFYSDSRVVLGYIHNQSRRFYTYVSNRVERIRHSSSPDQWNYVPSHLNPADAGSRGVSPSKLSDSLWFSGPPFLAKQSKEHADDFPLVEPDHDLEVRPSVSVKKTAVGESLSPANYLGTERFERFSSWSRLVMALSTLRHVAVSFREKQLSCGGWHYCQKARSVESKHDIELLILKEVQLERYSEEIDHLREGRPLHKGSSIAPLDPFLDKDGLVRVGGRLSRADLKNMEKHPILLPGKHHVSKLLVRHFHEIVCHQGRLLTEGAIRAAGYWITGVKRLVSSLIFGCVSCRKLRGKFQFQKMSDLPEDRVESATPFSYVGVDVFGPWTVVTRRTRGGQASSKRWAVLFTCLVIRAVHIEVIEEMSSSAFINALRRFTAVRGKVKQYRSDRGTNFVGATDNLGIDAINVEDDKSKKFLYDSGSVWIFHAPHSSHMGGAWERLIGTARRILESMLSEVKSLTHDVLVTLMAEVGAIINARPIVPVSTDVTDPEVLSPSVLLTMKFVDEEQPVADLNIKNLYKSQWQQVRFLADKFWVKWRRDFLQSLQARRKWMSPQENLKEGDVVLMKDNEVGRCYWPMGRIQRVFPSDDGMVRKVELCIVKGGKKSSYIRPVVELVKLV